MNAGTVVGGRFRLDERLATGGMGAVWRGWDLRLERPVAVKVLRTDLEDEHRPVDRFTREATTLAKLTGTGYVEIHDFGETEVDGETVLFIAMELIANGSLGRRLDRCGTLSARETLKVLAEAAAALDKAHRLGVVHRDVKPANLLIDDDGHVRVVDFGISLLESGSRLTPSSAVFGTLDYIAPEQLRRGADVTGRADVYALGAVAYECLTGAPPFDGAEAAVKMHDVLWEDPPALPDAVDPETAAIVMRCLRKAPAERFDSAADLAAACLAALGEPGADLDTALTPPPERVQPEPAQPEPEAAATERAKRRRPWLLPIVLVVPVAVAGTVITRPWQYLPDAEAAGQNPTTAVEQTTEPDTTGPATTSPTIESTTSAAPEPQPGGDATRTEGSGDSAGSEDSGSTGDTDPDDEGPNLPGSGVHRARQAASGLCMTWGPEPGNEDRSVMVLGDCSDTEPDLNWVESGGAYEIEMRRSDWTPCLTVDEGGTEDGMLLGMDGCDGLDAQTWVLVPAGNAFQMRTEASDSLCLAVLKSSDADEGDALALQNCNASDAKQQWTIL
ncbi:serine/threonine protein kinase [Glycomyces paridis]|uniref:non-specific serine/threonine protein kinase n=1 Tax=Glycomyces paridis TaxID=2126555 RepID=A0A4V4HMF7_9ACTN|nr:serine/threonine-protein kinase [Glycomyces paridis]THV22046.1 serine/threonine protein kinase [Glycomyces paridis]